MARVVMTGRSMDRLVNFSDAVVAVAVTVMILPIVEVAGPTAGESMLDVLQQNLGLLIAYVFTFYVVITMWLAHNRVFNALHGFDGRVIAYNTIWLLMIGFLPWPSSLIGEGDGVGHGIGVLYFGTLAVATLMMLLMTLHVRASPELLGHEGQVFTGGIRRGVGYLTAFVVLAGMSLVSSTATNWLLLSLPFIGVVLQPRRERALDAGDDAPAEHGPSAGGHDASASDTRPST